MKKRTLSYLALSFALVAAFGISTLSSAPDLTAEPFCTRTTCAGATTQTVGPITATSNDDCMWAEMSAQGQLSAQIDCPFGFCDGPDYIITSACTAQSAPYTVEMKATYSCARCIGPFQQ